MSARKATEIKTPKFIDGAPSVSESPEKPKRPPRLGVELTDEMDRAVALAKARAGKTIKELTYEALEAHPDIARALAELRKNPTE